MQYKMLLVAAALAGAAEVRGAEGASLPPMPTVRAPFAGKTVGACARQPLKFAYDGVSAARGENMEFDSRMYRLRVRRRGDPFMMLWPALAGEDIPWGVFGTTNRIANVLGADGAATRSGIVPFKKGTGSFRQILRADGPGRCSIDTDVRTAGAVRNCITGFTVLWEDNNAWRFGTIRVTGSDGTGTFTGESLTVRNPVRLTYETGEPDGTCGVEFPKGLFASARLHVQKNGVHVSLALAKDRIGDPVRMVYDFGEKAVPLPPGPTSVNGTDFMEEGDLAYVCWDRMHNVLPNPSFESDGRYWKGGKLRTDLAHSGKQSMELVPGLASFAVPMAAGETNVLSLWARSTDGKPHTLSVSFRHWSVDSSVPVPKHKSLKVPGGAEWTRLECAFFEPLPAAGLNFSGVGVVVDDVQLERGAKASAYTMPPWGFAMENAGEDPYFADAAKPIGAKLVFRGPAGAKGAVDVKVLSFFEEETFSASFPFALDATGETRFALPDAAFRLKGANTVVATVRPTDGAADLRPFTDHVRFSVYTYANGTAKNRALHQYSSISGHNRGQLKVPESYFRMMKTTGIAPRCRSVQDEEGVYPPEMARAIVKRYTDIGGMTFGYVWADSVRSGKRRPQFLEKLEARGFANPVTAEKIADPDAFAKAVEEVTAEIVAAAPWAEVWIGPDEISGAWKCMSTDDGTLAAKVLMAMHRGVKKGNPKASFICYSTCNSGDTARTELRNFFAAAKRLDPTFKFDAVDPHPYRCFYEGDTDVDADWEKIFKTLDDCGQPQCVCYSFGGGYAYPFYLASWNGIAPWAGVFQKDVYAHLGLIGYAMGWGERVAAAMQLRFNLAAYKHAPRLKTNSNWTPWSIDALNPHAPNVATAAQTELLGDAHIYKDVRFAPDCRAYVFDDGHGHATAVFWKFSKDLDRGLEKGTTLALDLSGLDAEFFDMMGNRREVKVEGQGQGGAGTAKLPLSNFPIYVRVPRAEADRLVAAFEGATSETARLTYANPIDLLYRVRPEAKHDFREGADPEIVLHADKYWLFASKCGGYYVSDDLASWRHIPSPDLPLEEYAPTVVELDGKLHFSSRGGTVWRAVDVMAGKWEKVKGQIPSVDSALFLDDDGRLYDYEGGSHSRQPTRVYEIDRRTMKPVAGAEVVPCFMADRSRYGYEARGHNNELVADAERLGCLEGSHMLKVGGKYYYQFAGPGTEYFSYSDTAFRGDTPKGPFARQRLNPFSFKPFGYAKGAGHGATFRDRHGNFWHVTTCTYFGVDRRIMLFPVFFDADGEMWCDTAFSDWPMAIPNRRCETPEAYHTGWMPLCDGKRATASSNGTTANRAADGDARTRWDASGAAGEWLQVDFGGVATVRAVQACFGECDAFDAWRKSDAARRWRVEATADGKSWRTIVDASSATDANDHAYRALAKPVRATAIRLVCVSLPPGARFAVRDLRAFGSMEKAGPAVPANLAVVRDAADARHAVLKWTAVPGASGYLVRFGPTPEKMHLSYVVRGAAQADLRCLDAKENYCWSVAAYNEAGFSQQCAVVATPFPR